MTDPNTYAEIQWAKYAMSCEGTHFISGHLEIYFPTFHEIKFQRTTKIIQVTCERCVCKDQSKPSAMFPQFASSYCFLDIILVLGRSCLLLASVLLLSWNSFSASCWAASSDHAVINRGLLNDVDELYSNYSCRGP